MKKSIEEIAFGKEPEWWNEQITLDMDYESKMLMSFNWYNYIKSNSDAVDYLKKWMLGSYDKSAIKSITNLKEWEIPNHVGWIARMLSLGNNMIPDDMLERFKTTIDELIKKGAKNPERNDEDQKTTVIKYPEKKYIAKFDDLVDTFLIDYSYDYDIFQEILKITKDKKDYKDFLRYVNGLFLEIDQVVTGKDKELVEAYHHINKTNLKKYHIFLKKFVEQLVLLNSSQKAKRTTKDKPQSSVAKKKKEKPIDIEYMKSFEELNIQSIPIESTLKSNVSCIVFYDTQKRMLHIMRKADNEKFSYKGKSLCGWSEEKSKSYMIRKPKETILKLMGCNQKQFDVELSKLSTKPKNARGKITPSTLILKSF